MLNCENCALTQHHCCKASISYTVMEVIHLSDQATKLGIDIKVLPSQERDNYFNIVRRDKKPSLLNDENCVFLKDGRCSIYDERPSICKVYGTEKVKCWFNDLDHDTEPSVIFDMDKDDITELTQKTMITNEESVLALFKSLME